ncbi:MAG TPA: hypothetical protein VHU40_09845, partial [Polyangia bacterium]|nr:hypothetical protein [Polyangia bacterium]
PERSEFETTPAWSRGAARPGQRGWPPLPSVPTESPANSPPADRPGPGSVDATALVEDLLAAIHSGDYDAFVAKGSASFRAALGTELFDGARAKLGARLARGRHVSPMGNFQRGHTRHWLFKMEFDDEGDDDLVSLSLNGWQIAGFFVSVPLPQLGESP